MSDNRGPLSNTLNDHYIRLHDLRIDIFKARNEYNDELTAYEKGCIDTIYKQLDQLEAAFRDTVQLIKALNTL